MPIEEDARLQRERLARLWAQQAMTAPQASPYDLTSPVMFDFAKNAAAPVAKDPPPSKNPDDKDKKEDTPKMSTARRPPANVGDFVYEVDTMKEMAAFGVVPTVILCLDHAHANCRSGFQSVSRLEQYAFLLNVALRRLYVLLKKRGVITQG